MTSLSNVITDACNKFLMEGLKDAINGYLQAREDNEEITVDEFLADYKPVKAKKTREPRERTLTQKAWTGYSKEQKAENPDLSSEDIGKAWKENKDSFDQEELERLAEIANTKSTKKPKERKISGSAWLGFRSKFAEDHADEFEKRDLTSAASQAWKDTKDSLDDDTIAEYVALAKANKDSKKAKEAKIVRRKPKTEEEPEEVVEPEVVIEVPKAKTKKEKVNAKKEVKAKVVDSDDDL
jgi:hypothetical protein